MKCLIQIEYTGEILEVVDLIVTAGFLYASSLGLEDFICKHFE